MAIKVILMHLVVCFCEFSYPRLQCTATFAKICVFFRVCLFYHYIQTLLHCC